MKTRTFVVLGLFAALLVAGVASYWASSHPDGLEYVAEQVGFDHAAEDSAAAGSPLADYQVKGVDNDALSGGLAGVVGALVVLVVAGGLAYVVRRRGTTDRDERTDDAPTPAEGADTDGTSATPRSRG